MPNLGSKPLALAFALCWLPVLPRLPHRLRGWGGVAVAIYLLGAVGGALLGNRLLAAYGLSSRPYLLSAAAGEVFEMGALVGLVALLLAHLRDTWGAVPIHLRPTPAPGLHLPPRSVALVLGAVVALLTAAYVVVYVIFAPDQFGPTLAPLLTRLNLDAEATFTAAFGGFLLLTAAAILGVIALYAHRTRARLALRWLALAVAFLGLTLDEFLSLHELLVGPVRRTLNVSGLLGFGWYVPVLPLVAVFGLFCLELVLRVPRRTGLLLALAGLVYVGGAVGVEMLAALTIETLGRASQWYLVEVVLEETLEMLGALLFIYALLDYLARGWGTLILDLRRPAPH